MSFDSKSGAAYLADILEDLKRKGKLKDIDVNRQIESMKDSVSERCKKIPPNKRRYLKGAEISRWVSRYGIGDLCIGPKGGVFVSVSRIKELGLDDELNERRYKQLEQVNRRYQSVIQNEKKNKYKPSISLMKFGNYEIRVPAKLKSVLDVYIEKGLEKDDVLLDRIASTLGYIVSSKDWSNIDKNKPVTSFDVDIYDVNNSLKLVGFLSFFSLDDEKADLVFEYMDLMRKYGNIPDDVKEDFLKRVSAAYGENVSKEKFETLVASFFVVGSVLGEHRDILLQFKSKYRSAKDAEERKKVIGELIWELTTGKLSDTKFSLWQLANSLSKYGIFSTKGGKAGISNKSSKEALGKKKKIMNFRIGVSKEILQQWESEGISENMKRVIILTGLLNTYYGIDLNTAIGISKGMELMAMRTHGTFSGNTSFLELFMKEKVFGNGRPMRVPTISSDSMRALRNFAERHVKPEDMYAYKSFIEAYVRDEFGDEIDVYRVLNLGEGMIVGTRKVAERYLNKLTQIENSTGKKLPRHLRILKSILQELVINDKLYGYSLSTSFDKNLVLKFAKRRAWTSKFLVKAKIKPRYVIGGFMDAPARYLDDAELTVIVPKVGIKYSIDEVVDIDLENASEDLKYNYLLTKILLGEDVNINDDEWDKVVNGLLRTLAKWTAQMLALNSYMDLRKEEYKRYWTQLLMALPLSLSAIGDAVSKSDRRKMEMYWNKVEAIFGNEKVWKFIFSLQSSSKAVRNIPISEADKYRVLFTVKYVYGFENVVKLFNNNVFKVIAEKMKQAF